MAFDYENQAHPCVAVWCSETVAYDDEPYCFKHSLDSGSTVLGYSYQDSHNKE